MVKTPYMLLFFVCFICVGYSQEKFVIQNKHKSDKIRFQLISNVIIIPLEINGVTLSFLFDSGVSKPIIFNFLNITESPEIKNNQTILLQGLGGGETIAALKSSNNVIKIGDAVKLNQDLYTVFNDKLNFASKLGVPIHGIIGYDILKDLIVEINYSRKYIQLTEPSAYKYKKCRKCEIFNLEFYNSKPYINAIVTIKKKNIPVKLLVDSGGSDALWLFEDDSLGIVSRDAYFKDFLGHGLSGSVYGKRSKIDGFSLNGFIFREANVAYPDSSTISYAKRVKERNGSVCGNILKRFNVIFDYSRAQMTLKRNSNFRSEFTYNRSGIELAHDGERLVKELDESLNSSKSVLGSNSTESNQTVVLDKKYKILLKPSFSIVELRKDSPAEKAGLMVGDVILSINGKQTYNFLLKDIAKFFHDDIGKRIRLKVDRNGIILNYEFLLEDVFK